MTDFFKGVVAGFLAALVLAGLGGALYYVHQRDEELYQYAAKEREIELLREDYRNRDPYEFFDDVPGVRRAAETSADEFRRKRDEALQRFRGRPVD